MKKPLADQKPKQMNKTLTKVIFVFTCRFYADWISIYTDWHSTRTYFHHNQPAFIVSSVFIGSFLKYPGGLAELTANLISQSFYFKIIGASVFALTFVIGWLTFLIINSINKSKLNYFGPFCQ